VNSESSKKDVVRYYGVTEEKIAVVYPGVDEVFHPVADQREFGRIEKQYGITRKYLIYVGSYQTEDKRKNVKFLLELVQYLNMNSRETWNLVLVGKKGVFADTLCRQAELLGVGNRVVFTDYVPDSDLAVILSNAECLLFPSLYEGFGLPLLEAMACGTPVVTFGNSSLREVVGDCGVIVGENSLDEFRLATLSLLSDNARLSILRQKGQEQARRFSWASAAQKVLAIYEHQLEERGDVSHRN
jgi:glycosyltransferase involved in cell wall biosynthesis